MARFSYHFLLLLSFQLKEASSCGSFFPTARQRSIHQSAASIAVGVDGNEVKTILEIDYEGPEEEFSWLYPVPYEPTFDLGSGAFLDLMFRTTAPTFELVVQEDGDTPTCTNYLPLPCDPEDTIFRDNGIATDGAGVSQVAIGPYDVAVIPTDDGDPQGVLDWLDENGYDLPEGSDALVNFYALQGMKFVALKLRSGRTVGELVPLQLTYTVPADEALGSSPSSTIAIPMQLSSIAATRAMKVQVYFFAEARVVPLNYLEVELDDRLVDWVGCAGDQPCFYNDYIARFNSAVQRIDNRTFTTEYAASTSTVLGLFGELDMTVTADDLLSVSDDPIEFLKTMANGGIPADTIVRSIVDEFIPAAFDAGFPFQCARLDHVYFQDADLIDTCAHLFNPPADWSFNGAALAFELDEVVLKPYGSAKEWLSNYGYLTRMYAQLGPENMNKDAFFGLNRLLPDVSNIHSAEGFPYCDANIPVALDIVLENGDTTQVSSIQGCPTWKRTQPLAYSAHPARQIAAWGFTENNRVVTPDLDGTFVDEAVLEAILFGESLVTVDQTIPVFDVGNVDIITDGDDNDPDSENIVDVIDGGTVVFDDVATSSSFIASMQASCVLAVIAMVALVL